MTLKPLEDFNGVLYDTSFKTLNSCFGHGGFRPGIVLIYGESGVGVSNLLEHWAAWFDQSYVTVYNNSQDDRRPAIFSTCYSNPDDIKSLIDDIAEVVILDFMSGVTFKNQYELRDFLSHLCQFALANNRLIIISVQSRLNIRTKDLIPESCYNTTAFSHYVIQLEKPEIVKNNGKIIGYFNEFYIRKSFQQLNNIRAYALYSINPAGFNFEYDTIMDFNHKNIVDHSHFLLNEESTHVNVYNKRHTGRYLFKDPKLITTIHKESNKK